MKKFFINILVITVIVLANPLYVYAGNQSVDNEQNKATVKKLLDEVLKVSNLKITQSIEYTEFFS